MPRVWKRAKDKARRDRPFQVTYRDRVRRGGKWLRVDRTTVGFTDRQESIAYGIRLEDEARKRMLGLIDPADAKRAQQRQRPLSEHIADYRSFLTGKGNTPKHTDETIGIIEEMAEKCGWTLIDEIDTAQASKHLETLAGSKLSARQINKVRGAARSFTKWMFIHGRLRTDPLLSLPVRRETTDRRLTRRALGDAELLALFSAASGSEPFVGRGVGGRGKARMTGPERAMLYRVAVGTGLRANELRSLTRDSFSLAGDSPTVTVPAAYSKRRRTDVQPIAQDLAAELKAYVTGRKPRDRLWDVPHNSAAMLHADMSAAGLAPKDKKGRVVDFHALRHTFITRLARAGIHPKVAQTLARHSTITLTMDTYTHSPTGDETSALAALPLLGGGAGGADGASGAAAAGKGRSAPGSGRRAESGSDEGSSTGTEGAENAARGPQSAQRRAQRAPGSRGQSGAVAGRTSGGIGSSRNARDSKQKPRDVPRGSEEKGGVGFEPTKLAQRICNPLHLSTLAPARRDPG